MESTLTSKPPSASGFLQLKYHQGDLGVCELVPKSGIYINKEALEIIKVVSYSHTTTAGNLLDALFHRQYLMESTVFSVQRSPAEPILCLTDTQLYEAAVEAILEFSHTFATANRWTTMTCHVVEKCLTKKLAVMGRRPAPRGGCPGQRLTVDIQRSVNCINDSNKE